MKQTLLFLGFFLSTLGSYSQCFSNISSGNYFNFGIKPNGTIWGWGSNNAFGQLGDGTETDIWVPTQITTSTDWQQVICGPYATFALKSNGTLWGTGNNTYGQLGIGSFFSILYFFVFMAGSTASPCHAPGTGRRILLPSPEGVTQLNTLAPQGRRLILTYYQNYLG